MRKLLLTILLFLCYTKQYAQPLYDRMWSTLSPIYERTVQPFSPTKKIVRINIFTAEINPKTGNLYIVNADGDEIFEYTPENPEPQSIYKLPASDEPGLSSIQSIKFDSKSNMIISGLAYNANLATSGAYSEDMIFSDGASIPTFISKIDSNGKLIWSTYFHNMAPSASYLTIDKNDNIYFLNKRHKNTVASPTNFQKNGDTLSIINNQDVISKLDADGRHIWSTFYAKDNSKIKSIKAGTNGLYIYGEHMGGNSSSNYFGTSGSYQEFISEGSSMSSVFLSKFNFDGERLWSTYFGAQTTNAPAGNVLNNNNTMEVIGDDVYILTSHLNTASRKTVNVSTENAYLEKPPSSSMKNITVSKFSGDGSRIWTSYLYSGEHLFSNGKDLFITSSSVEEKVQNNALPVTSNGYQTRYGGSSDTYTIILSTDGKNLKYGSFYGYEGKDSGVLLPTEKGFYIIGHTNFNLSSETPFVTSNAPKSNLTLSERTYLGDYISYFRLKNK